MAYNRTHNSFLFLLCSTYLNHNHTLPTPSLTCFLPLCKENSMNAKAETPWIFVSPQGAYLRWALWLECKEPSKGVSIALEKISRELSGMVVLYFPEGATFNIAFRGASSAGSGLPTFAFGILIFFFFFCPSVTANAGFDITKLNGWKNHPRLLLTKANPQITVIPIVIMCLCIF